MILVILLEVLILILMLPDEDVYKPKSTENAKKKGLENFMEDEIDKVAEEVMSVEDCNSY